LLFKCNLCRSTEACVALSRKSAARALFRAAEVNVAPGAPVLPEWANSGFYDDDHGGGDGGGGGGGDDDGADAFLHMGMLAGFARGRDGWWGPRTS
jgi:hypothetical protein